LRSEIEPRLERAVEVVVDDQSAEIVPSEVDVVFAARRTVDEAMATGRLASMLQPFFYARDIAPIMDIPDKPRIPATLRLATQDPQPAKVKVVDGEAKVTPAKAGRSVDARGVVEAATAAAIAGESRVVLETEPREPAISTADARAAAEQVERVISAPVNIVVKGQRIGAVPTAVLADAVIVKNEGGKAVIALRPRVLAPTLNEILGDRIREPRNAIWGTDGQKAWVVPAVNGVGYQPGKASNAIRNAALQGGQRSAEIDLGGILPRRSTEEAESYGITTKVAGGITNLGDSAPDRIHNVALMAEILDLRLVMPGETFSFNDAVGPRTPERGFREGLAISGGFLLPSIGGGICQVSTTLFQAAYTMGLPIVERINHSFYINKYTVGLDATVAWGGPDFRFSNDTAHPILIRATADGSSMIVNLYSAPRNGYSVETETSDLRDVKEPEKRFLFDELVAPGLIIQQTSGTEGFSLDVTRIIRKDGEIISRQSFNSSYDMEPQIFLVGPETELPDGAVVEPPPSGWVSPFAAR
jgi:vancomycin resistance protein YoaR